MSFMLALRRLGSRVAVGPVAVVSPAPGQVRLRVHLAGVCRTDTLAACGRIPSRDGVILGHEFAGTVDALGPGVTGLHQGQRVAVCPVFGCLNCAVCGAGDEINCPRRTMLGIEHDGAFAEFVCVPQRCVLAIPDSLSWGGAAYAEPLAAALAVLEAVGRDGRTLVLGSNRFADLVVRVLQLYGIADVHRWGPTAVQPEPDRFDFVIETGLGPETLAQMIQLSRTGGTLVLKSRVPGDVPLDVLALVRKRLRIHAVQYGSFRTAVNLLAEGRLKVDALCGDVLPLSAFEKAFALEASGEATKVFLDPRQR